MSRPQTVIYRSNHIISPSRPKRCSCKHSGTQDLCGEWPDRWTSGSWRDSWEDDKMYLHQALDKNGYRKKNVNKAILCVTKHMDKHQLNYLGRRPFYGTWMQKRITSASSCGSTTLSPFSTQLWTPNCYLVWWKTRFTLKKVRSTKYLAPVPSFDAVYSLHTQLQLKHN